MKSISRFNLIAAATAVSLAVACGSSNVSGRAATAPGNGVTNMQPSHEETGGSRNPSGGSNGSAPFDVGRGSDNPNPSGGTLRGGPSGGTR